MMLTQDGKYVCSLCGTPERSSFPEELFGFAVAACGNNRRQPNRDAIDRTADRATWEGGFS
jgi:hypothetical protein